MKLFQDAPQFAYSQEISRSQIYLHPHLHKLSLPIILPSDLLASVYIYITFPRLHRQPSTFQILPTPSNPSTPNHHSIINPLSPSLSSDLSYQTIKQTDKSIQLILPFFPFSLTHLFLSAQFTNYILTDILTLAILRHLIILPNKPHPPSHPATTTHTFPKPTYHLRYSAQPITLNTTFLPSFTTKTTKINHPPSRDREIKSPIPSHDFHSYNRFIRS